MTPPQRIVIKIGTSTLTGGGKKLSAPQLVDLARQLSALMAEKTQVVLVSSGAIAAGRGRRKATGGRGLTTARRGPR